jgi:hypothetical protein
VGAFAVTEDSFHGREEVPTGDVDRFMVQLFYYVNPLSSKKSSSSQDPSPRKD